MSRGASAANDSSASFESLSMKTPTSNCPCNAYQRCQSQLERKDRAIFPLQREQKMEERRGDEGARCLQRAVQMASSPSSKTQTGGMGARDVAHALSEALVMSLCTDMYVHAHRQKHDSHTLTTCNQLAFNLFSAASFFQGRSHTVWPWRIHFNEL